MELVEEKLSIYAWLIYYGGAPQTLNLDMDTDIQQRQSVMNVVY